MYETYPEYADVRVLRKDFGLEESEEKLEEALRQDWWCVVRRVVKYSSHSDSSLVEVFVLIKKPYGKENFQAGSDGKILYVGQGRRKELVYSSHAASGARRFVIVDTTPVKAFYLRHKGEGFRAFRFTSELHFVKETRNKLDVHQYLQSHMGEVHPVFTRQYFARLIEFVKGDKENNQGELEEKLLQEFRRPIAAFKKLQAVEHEERARLEEQKRQQAEAAEAEAAVSAMHVAGYYGPEGDTAGFAQQEEQQYQPGVDQFPMQCHTPPPPSHTLEEGEQQPPVAQKVESASPDMIDFMDGLTPDPAPAKPYVAPEPSQMPELDDPFQPAPSQQVVGQGQGQGQGGQVPSSWINFGPQSTAEAASM